MSLARCLVLAAAAVLGGWALSAAAQWQIAMSDILGREVRTSNGERLVIRDLAIDPATRRVEYLVLGRPGTDAQHHLGLYPISALRSGAGDELLLVLPEDSSSAGGNAPPAHLGVSKLGRPNDMVLQLHDGTVSAAAP